MDEIKNTGIYSGFGWYADYPHHFAGDPTEATAENGRLIFDILKTRIIKMINCIKTDDSTLPLIKEYNSKTDTPVG